MAGRLQYLQHEAYEIEGVVTNAFYHIQAGREILRLWLAGELKGADLETLAGILKEAADKLREVIPNQRPD